jgi:serine/threonine protein phosphatase PrpC
MTAQAAGDSMAANVAGPATDGQDGVADQTPRDQALRDQSLRDQTIRDQALRDQSIRDLATAAPVIGGVLPSHARDVLPGQALRRSDVSLDGFASGDFQVAAASIVGSGHLAAGTGRQDSYGMFLDRTGRLYAVLADGLGSRPSSQLGAHLMCESVGLLVSDHDDEVGPGAGDLILAASARTGHIAATAYGLAPRDVACVCLVAVVDSTGGQLARVGDASAFVLADDTFTELFETDEQYVNQVSASVPDDDVATAIETAPVPTDGTLVLATDGLVIDIRNSATVREWLGTCWRGPVGPFAMGDSLRFRRQGSHDDRTGVVIWRSTSDRESPVVCPSHS